MELQTTFHNWHSQFSWCMHMTEVDLKERTALLIMKTQIQQTLCTIKTESLILELHFRFPKRNSIFRNAFAVAREKDPTTRFDPQKGKNDQSVCSPDVTTRAGAVQRLFIKKAIACDGT